MRRHQTETSYYKELIRRQEPHWFGRMTFTRHVLRLFKDDPEINTGNLGSRLAMASYLTKHMATNLPGGRWLSPLRPVLRLFANVIGGIAWRLP